jgi:hypothetical protein
VIADDLTGVAIFGTLYRCRLRYSHIGDPDGLSQFILKVARESPQYARIDVLTRSFGLPGRIIEDILADLIRTRQAWLDIARGIIVPVKEGARYSAVFEDRGTLDVWQDHATGAILPATLVGPYIGKIDGAKQLTRATGDGFVGFLDVPDAELLSLLSRVDPTIGFSIDGNWQLDRFINRVRIGPEVLYVPVRSSHIGDSKRSFIEAPELPFWLSKTWSTLLTSDKQFLPLLSPGVDILRDVDIHRPTALQHAELQYYARRWLDAAEETVNIVPPPESLQEIRTFNQTFASLQQRLLTLACFSIVNTLPPARERTFTASGSVTANKSARENVKPIQLGADNFILDAHRLYFPISVLNKDSFFEIISQDVGRAVQGLLQRQTAPEYAQFSSHRSSISRDSLRNARLLDGLTIHEVLDQLSDYRRELAIAMQSGRLQKREETDLGTGRDDTDALVQAAEDVPKLPLRATHPDLAAKLEGLRLELRKPLQPGHSALSFVERYELLELLDLIVDQQPGSSNLCRIASPLSEDAFDDAVIDVLKRGLARGWRFRLYVSPSDEQAEYSRRLRARVSSAHIRLFFAPEEWIPGMVTLNDLVIIGSFKLFADRSSSRLERSFAIVLQDGLVGDRLFQGSESWLEVL